MTAKLEIEYKTLLNHNHASQLLSTGSFNFLGKQNNLYLDNTDSFFQSKRMVLRIRTKADSYLFTAKIESNDGLREIEFPLDNNDINNQKIVEFASKYTDNVTLIETGSTLTYRYVLDDEFGQWCLDFNVFKFSSDVELEYELHDNITDKKDHFLEKLKSWGIPYQPCSSKFIRMLNDKKIIAT
jgi:uncharacterized protein YjbK